MAAGCRAVRVQAVPGLPLQQGWRLESPRRVRAVPAPVEVRAVPAEDRPEAEEEEDGRGIIPPKPVPGLQFIVPTNIRTNLESRGLHPITKLLDPLFGLPTAKDVGALFRTVEALKFPFTCAPT